MASSVMWAVFFHKDYIKPHRSRTSLALRLRAAGHVFFRAFQRT